MTQRQEDAVAESILGIVLGLLLSVGVIIAQFGKWSEYSEQQTQEAKQDNTNENVLKWYWRNETFNE